MVSPLPRLDSGHPSLTSRKRDSERDSEAHQKYFDSEVSSSDVDSCDSPASGPLYNGPSPQLAEADGHEAEEAPVTRADSRNAPASPTAAPVRQWYLHVPVQRCKTSVGVVHDWFSCLSPVQIRPFKFSRSKPSPIAISHQSSVHVDQTPPVIIHEPRFSSHIFSPTYANVEDLYEFRELIGRGAMGLVYRCIERESGREWACKTVRKSLLTCPEEVATIRQEVAAMLQLKGHPAVVSLHDVLEDKEVSDFAPHS